MIDGGPRGVYGAQLKPRLQAIRKARGLEANKPLDVDLLMVSHVDGDHIQGILDLTKELQNIASELASNRAERWLVQIEELRGALEVNLNRKIASDGLLMSMAAA